MTLPNHSASMWGFCKGYAETPLLALRFRWGTQVFSYYAVTSAAECSSHLRISIEDSQTRLSAVPASVLAQRNSWGWCLERR